MSLDKLRAKFSWQTLQKGGLDIGGANAIDSKALRPVLGRCILREPHDAMFGCGVRAIADRGYGAMYRRHVYDRAVLRAGLEHRRDLVPHSVQHSIQVDVNNAIPLAQISFSRSSSCTADAGVVDSVVKCAVRRDGKVHDTLRLICLGGVLLYRARCATTFLDFGGDTVGGFHVNVGEDNRRPVFGEHLPD
jgi:hypothetical protein